MRRTRMLCLEVAVLTMGLCFRPSSVASQPLPLREFPPFRVTEAYALATGQIARSHIEEGRQALLRIAQENPNTTLGATSLFTAAFYSSEQQESIALYQRIIAEYPQTRFELQARQGLLSLQATSKEQWLADADRLIGSYGAPTVQEIVQNPTRAGTKYRVLPLDYQRAFVQYYDHASANLWNQSRLSEAFAVNQFGMDVLVLVDPESYPGFASKAWHNLETLNGPDRGPYPPLNPEVRILKPHGSVPKNTGPRPRIRLEARQKGVSTPISLAKATFRMDGQDIKSDIQVIKHSFNLNLKKTKDYFERLRLAYRPRIDLAPGPHLFTATIPSGLSKGIGQGTAQVSIQLDVRRPQDDDDDVDKHDEDDWDDSW